MYLLQLMDNYVGGWTLLMIGFAENMAIAFCYGRQNKCCIAIQLTKRRVCPTQQSNLTQSDKNIHFGLNSLSSCLIPSVGRMVSR